MMYTFHVAIHARPAAVHTGERLHIAGHEVATLDVPANERCSVLTVTFEEAAEKLARLPRMFCEPDGSFVWVAESGAVPWQVDGQLYDGHGRLAYIELKGMCPESCFNLLLEVCAWPDSPLMFQLVRQGVFLSEASFRASALA